MKIIINANCVNISVYQEPNLPSPAVIADAVKEATIETSFVPPGISLYSPQASFKFDLTQMVDILASGEFGEVRARSQHVEGMNQYLIHYKSAVGTASTAWFDESMIGASECSEHPGCPIYAGMPLPNNAKVEA